LPFLSRRISVLCDDWRMRRALLLVPLVTLATAVPLACGSDPARDPALVPAPDAAAPDDAYRPATSAPDTAPAPLPKAIKHIVLIVQENHTFDSYFGAYCTAKAGSDPSCTVGPACCEAAPAKEPTGASPVVLDDEENAGYDPPHTYVCEFDQVDHGLMDRFVKGAECSNPRNFAVAPAGSLPLYHGWAQRFALGDRYFQPVLGSSSSNDMYLAVARFVFEDNKVKPDSIGAGCTLPATKGKYSGVTTLPDLLIQRNFRFAAYLQGYYATRQSSFCVAPPADCPARLPTPPCTYDPSDTPFQYYEQFTDNLTYMRDYTDLARDIADGKLADFVYVKAVQYRNEHPGYGTKMSMGFTFVKDTVDAIFSKYADDTLILLTWDEGGGYFDHVPPPPTSKVDGKPYGTRVPILAIGKFARRNFVSHVVMEHSSIVKFVEWNFLDKTGQLAGRDAEVHSIASLLDPTTTRLPPD
jgi:phospholipase C